jgi:hypothetical protein
MKPTLLAALFTGQKGKGQVKKIILFVSLNFPRPTMGWGGGRERGVWLVRQYGFCPNMYTGWPAGWLRNWFGPHRPDGFLTTRSVPTFRPISARDGDSMNGRGVDQLS